MIVLNEVPYEMSTYSRCGIQIMPNNPVPNVNKMMLSILELQQRLVEVSCNMDLFTSQNAILEEKIRNLELAFS